MRRSMSSLWWPDSNQTASGKPGAVHTDNVWFYDMQADGFSLDDKRTPQLDKSDLADILARWQQRDAEGDRARTDQSFLVPKAEIAVALEESFLPKRTCSSPPSATGSAPALARLRVRLMRRQLPSSITRSNLPKSFPSLLNATHKSLIF